MAAVDDKFITRLHAGIRKSHAKLRGFRKNRLLALRQFVGVYYGDRSGDLTTANEPLNMIYSAASVYVPNLVAQNPATMVSARIPALSPGALTFELAMNHLVREMDMRLTLRELITDSIFGVAIAKIGLGHGGQVDFDGELHDVGQPFFDRVSLDDYVVDPSATRREEADFEGNRYRVPLEFAKSFFDGGDKLKATHYPHGEPGRAESLGGARETDSEIEEYAEVYDIYLPRENLMITVPTEANGNQVLRMVEWEGPERGPYLMLGYITVPDNLMPLAPVHIWLDLHLLINTIARKMKRQAEREKTILAYEQAAVEDAGRVRDADDGDIVAVNNVDRLKEVKFGGTQGQTEALVMYLSQFFSRIAGNVDLVGGLSASARSATEAAFLQGNASIRLTDMRTQVYNFVKDACERLGWYLWHDPFIEAPLVKRVEGVNMDIPVRFTPEEREGDLEDYMIEIEPYSMQVKTPEEMAKITLDWWNSVVLPTLPLSLQQGYAPNVPALVKQVGRRIGVPNMDELYVPIPQPPMLGAPLNQTPGAPQMRSQPSGMPPGGQPMKAQPWDLQYGEEFQEAQQGAPQPAAPAGAGVR